MKNTTPTIHISTAVTSSELIMINFFYSAYILRNLSSEAQQTRIIKHYIVTHIARRCKIVKFNILILCDENHVHDSRTPVVKRRTLHYDPLTTVELSRLLITTLRNQVRKLVLVLKLFTHYRRENQQIVSLFQII